MRRLFLLTVCSAAWHPDNWHSINSFLDNARRVASKSYEPTDDDILHARLRTVGVQEYRLPFDKNSTRLLPSDSCSVLTDCTTLAEPQGKEWRIYDVGGSRTMVSCCARAATVAH